MAKLRRRCGTGAVLLCLGISGCGGSDSSPTAAPTPTPAPTPSPRTVVAQDNFPLDVGMVVGTFFDISSTGTIAALVNYTFADSLVAVWLARGECTAELFSTDQCSYVATSFDNPPPSSPAAKEDSATSLFTTNQPAGTYTLIISNGGPDKERFAVQVIFIAQASAASRSGGGELSSRGTGHWVGQHVVLEVE